MHGASTGSSEASVYFMPMRSTVTLWRFPAAAAVIVTVYLSKLSVIHNGSSGGSICCVYLLLRSTVTLREPLSLFVGACNSKQGRLCYRSTK